MNATVTTDQRLFKGNPKLFNTLGAGEINEFIWA